jgi:hypothetical protein
LQNKPVIKFQGILGLAVLAAAGFFAWSQLGGMVFEERPVRALAEARELAAATLDYYHDTGKWPQTPDRQIDLTLLLGQPTDRKATALAGSPGSGLGGLPGTQTPPSHLGAGRFWLKEIPLDPWDRPYLVRVTDVAIGVLSTGPNMKLDTDWSRMWARPGNMNPCDGDDVGMVMEIDPHGGP